MRGRWGGGGSTRGRQGPGNLSLKYTNTHTHTNVHTHVHDKSSGAPPTSPVHVAKLQRPDWAQPGVQPGVKESKPDLQVFGLLNRAAALALLKHTGLAHEARGVGTKARGLTKQGVVMRGARRSHRRSRAKGTGGSWERGAGKKRLSSLLSLLVALDSAMVGSWVCKGVAWRRRHLNRHWRVCLVGWHSQQTFQGGVVRAPSLCFHLGKLHQLFNSEQQLQWDV